MKPASASPHPAANCQEPSSCGQHFFIGHVTSPIVHLLLPVVLVVVLTVARPHHRPHCNVAMVFPYDHVESPTTVHFLRRDATCRSPFSLRCQSSFRVTSSSLPLLHMRFCNRSRSTGKSFSPPFPNSRHCGHSAVTTRQSNDNLAKDFLPIDFLHVGSLTLRHCRGRLFRCSPSQSPLSIDSATL